MYPKIFKAQSLNFATSLWYLAGSLRTTVCLNVACTPMVMSVLGLNFEAPAASFTSKFFKKNIKLQVAKDL